MRFGECEQVEIGKVSGGEHLVVVKELLIAETDGIRPEMVVGGCCGLTKASGYVSYR